MDSLEDYDRQLAKRQVYMLSEMQIRIKIPNVTFYLQRL